MPARCRCRRSTTTPAAFFTAVFVSGVVDNPPQQGMSTLKPGCEDAQRVEENSIVLLKNSNSILPIDPSKSPQHRNHRRARRCRHDLRRRLRASRPARRQRHYAPRQGRNPLAGTHLVSHFSAQSAPGKTAEYENHIRSRHQPAIRRHPRPQLRPGHRLCLAVGIGRGMDLAEPLATRQSGRIDRAGCRGQSPHHRRA